MKRTWAGCTLPNKLPVRHPRWTLCGFHLASGGAIRQEIRFKITTPRGSAGGFMHIVVLYTQESSVALFTPVGAALMIIVRTWRCLLSETQFQPSPTESNPQNKALKSVAGDRWQWVGKVPAKWVGAAGKLKSSWNVSPMPEGLLSSTIVCCRNSLALSLFFSLSTKRTESYPSRCKPNIFCCCVYTKVKE